LGFTLRRFLLSGGIRSVTTRKNPHTVSLAVSPPPKRRAGPIGPGFWALALPRVPGDRTRCWPADRWSLPWVSPFQGASAIALAGISPNLLSRASQARQVILSPTAPQSLNRLPPRLCRMPCLHTTPPEATLLGFLHRLIPDHSSAPHPGYCFRLSSGRAFLPTHRRSLEDGLALPELSGSAEVPNIRDLFVERREVAMFALPFRVFGIVARPPASPPQVVLFWNWLLAQSR